MMIRNSGLATAERGEISVTRAPDGTLVVRLAGAWRLRGALPTLDAIEHELAASAPPRAVAFDARDIASWDSSLLMFLVRVREECEQRGIPVVPDGLPSGVGRLLALAEVVPKRDARGEQKRVSFVERVGLAALAGFDAASEFLGFLGEVSVALWHVIRGRARVRVGDLLVFMQEAGAQALPIVSLISFLVGTILAFVGAIQLEKFAAEIYVAGAVGIGMAREMGAMMTAIVMAGRTGASYAAQLGSMNVTQEIEALETMGISPLEFLVLPRMIALSVMMPLLCLYSDLLGILGGFAVGWGMLGIAPRVYYDQTVYSVDLGDVMGGVFKASVYGILIAVAGCLRGLQSGRSASAVGEATTSAVVTGIVLVICACGIFAVTFYILGI
jgi:phospholipid/cholesterol/gamma-HCH transport system permease protein